jgi:eukaryotic-like serine/threonine-protein kinase
MELPVQVGAVVDDKYRIDAFLGSGAMSVVALAHHLELEQPVAIKFLRAQGFDPEQTAQRFKREARAGARIQSEHVVRVLDVGALPGGCPYIVMEYLKGQDLGRELAERGRLSATEAAGYMLEACEALAEAHAVGIVHRDLKPENLFLAERGGGTRTLKLLDFGISKSAMGSSLTDLALTRTATFMGSPLYMSPEQMRSPRNVDARSDIWSLGAILYEVLSGRLPFNAESIPELCLSVISDEPPPLSTLVPDVPPGLEEVVRRCLEKDRDRRYATVAELAVALGPFAPREASTAERTRRILELPSAALEPRAQQHERSARVSRLVAPPSTPSHDSLVPLSRRRGEHVTTSSPAAASATRRAPLFGAAAIVLLGAGWWLLRGQAVEPAVTASAAATPTDEQPAAPIAPEPIAAETKTSLAVEAPAPPPSASAHGGKKGEQARVRARPASVKGAAASSTRAPSPAGSSAPNAWDPSAFGGRY